MNKKDLVRCIYYNPNYNVTSKQAKLLVEDVFNTVSFWVSLHNKVRIKDFGTFEKRTVKERKRRNPNNGKEVIVPEHEEVVFRPSKNFLKE